MLKIGGHSGEKKLLTPPKNTEITLAPGNMTHYGIAPVFSIHTTFDKHWDRGIMISLVQKH